MRFIKLFKTEYSKKKFLLVFIAAAMFLAIAGFVIYNFIFLISHFNKALRIALEPSFSDGFDIEGFERLNLVK